MQHNCFVYIDLRLFSFFQYCDRLILMHNYTFLVTCEKHQGLNPVGHFILTGQTSWNANHP